MSWPRISKKNWASATCSVNFSSSRSAALTWAAYSCECTWLRIRPHRSGVQETDMGADQMVEVWPVLAVDELRRLPELLERFHPGPRVTVGQYWARASATRARASMKFSNEARMFWLLTVS